jgi:hypothetical protein
MPDRETKHAYSEHLPGVKHQQSSNISSSDLSLRGRRRFVKAMSFTLPAVMTLYHGAVLAMSSSATRCLLARHPGDNRSGLVEMGEKNPALPGPYEATLEETVCRTVEVVEYKFDDNHKNPFTPEILRFYQDHNFAQEWRYPDGSGTGSYTKGELDKHVREIWGKFDAKGSTNSGSELLGGRYCAVAEVNDKGRIARYGNPNAVAMPVSQSCWLSVHPNV